MYFNPISRRYFLRGLGVSLALPFLPSIMRNAYGAGVVPPPRYFQFINPWGVYGQMYFPSDDGLVAQTGSGIFARPLSGISGNISPILASDWTAYKNKISIVRGIDVLGVRPPVHNGSYPTCASSTIGTSPTDSGDYSPPNYPYSVDTLLSDSAKIYPDATGKQRLVNFTPVPLSYKNFSWTKKNGIVQHQPNTTDTGALLAKFAPLTNTSPTQSPTAARNLDILQNVYADYKKVRDSKQISTVDRNSFDAYIALIEDVQKGTQAQAAICSKPTQEQQSDIFATTRNQINIAIAAMVCQLTRVCSITMSQVSEPIHGWAHNTSLNIQDSTTNHSNYIRDQFGHNVAYAISQMDQITEAGGTLLDNSLVYWGNEFGEITYLANPGNPQQSDPHHPDNMVALLAGGAGGNLQMGSYINFKKTHNRPLNNLLITILNAMGLSSTDYERDGLIGVGEYSQSVISASAGMADYVTTAERRKPLPVLYKGPTRG